MHTVAIEWDSVEQAFALYEVDDNNEKASDPIEFHSDFMNAQNHACMLLSETGDFRISTRQPPHFHGEKEHFHAPGEGAALNPSTEFPDDYEV